MTEPTVRVRDLVWRTPSGTAVLHGVSLDVYPGEFVAVMGRNGAGKSTLLDLISGLRSPAAGTVGIAGRRHDEWNPAARARTLAHMPQSLRSDLALRAEELVLMGRYPHATRWFESEADIQVAHQAMARCGCLGFRQRLLSTLSGGERQRVYLAACLAQGAGVLLLDEPATFLDVDQQLQCFSVVREEARRGVACIAVTHDVNIALSFCTRLVVLADGCVARDMPVTEALGDPSWLRSFSTRLTLEHDAAGAWVRYR